MSLALGGDGVEICIACGDDTCGPYWALRICCGCPRVRARASAARRMASDTRCTGSTGNGAVFGSECAEGVVPSCTQRTDWEHVPHVVRAEDTRRSSAHVVTHGAASQQGLQHAIAQARSSASLFKWIIDVGRRTDVLHRFRLQRRSEAWSSGPLWAAVERSLDLNHGEGRRQPPRLYWGGTASNRRKGNCFSETGWFSDGLMFRRPC